MIKLILFFKKIHYVLLFVVLEAVALNYYANSSSYTKVKLVTASNYVVGGIYSQMAGVNSYLYLRQQNQALNAELVRLQNLLDGVPSFERGVDSLGDGWMDSLGRTLGVREYAYVSARVVNNSLTHQENYITLNRGAQDGIVPNMALVSAGAVVGYVADCSDHFSVGVSVLNRNFRGSGRVRGTDYFGSIIWDGVDSEYVVLTEFSKYAQISRGDTVETTEYSSIFPAGLVIGTVDTMELKNQTYYDVRVKLQANMAALDNVIAVKYLDAGEKLSLEEQVASGL